MGNFTTTSDEMEALLGVNYIMAINPLMQLSYYWETDMYIGNTGVQNIFIRERFKSVFQNLHFADNMQPKDDKAQKIRLIIDHLNNAFLKNYCHDSEQSIDEHMTKFKGRSPMKQYIKSKPIKWGFKWWFRCPSTNGYFYKFDLYLGRKEVTEINLGEGVVLDLAEK